MSPRGGTISLTLQQRSGPANTGPDQGPLIILTYAQSGAAHLQRALADQADRGGLACTSGTGILAACHAAAAAWRAVDGRDGPPSRLAVASIRTLADGLITAILAGHGGPRWCEISIAPPWHADAFLAAYPVARVVCLHRRCSDVIGAALQASPWGLDGTPFGAFAGAYPGNAIAAAAAYWAAHARALLEFERAHQAACRRLKYEELANGADAIPADLKAFLGLAPGAAQPAAAPGASSARIGPPPAAGPAEPAAVSAAPAAPFPAERIPAELSRRISELSDQLGYPP